MLAVISNITAILNKCIIWGKGSMGKDNLGGKSHNGEQNL